jgi:hypothetical protein
MVLCLQRGHTRDAIFEAPEFANSIDSDEALTQAEFDLRVFDGMGSGWHTFIVVERERMDPLWWTSSGLLMQVSTWTGNWPRVR